MRKEFWYWILTALEDMAKRAGNDLSSVQRQDLLKTIQGFSNEDYETVSDGLTYAIETKLHLYGFRIDDAIRMAWKWSD